MSNLDDSALLYWIWLSKATTNAPGMANTLLKYFGSAEAVFEADESALEQTGYNFRGRISALMNKDLAEAESILAYCREHDVGIVTLSDFFYPERLKGIFNRPILMYYLGNFIDFDATPCVAVVGTRRVSDYGVHCAKRISFDLAKAGAVTVSGLAAGVDSCAHRASLYCGAFTVGVLGCGIDTVYPKENADLYAEVAKNGLILTEYAPSTSPSGKNFPIRNRIISGLSCATAVIEGSARSGALITAEYALRQRRPLYAVPGSIFFEGSAGSNALLNLGAKPLLSAEAILEKLAEDFPEKIRLRSGAPEPEAKRPKKKLFSSQKDVPSSEADIPPLFVEKSEDAPEEEDRPRFRPADPEEAEESAARPSITELNEAQMKIYMKLSDRPVLADTLVDEETSVREVLKTLTALELKGFVKKQPGGKFSVADEE